MLRALVEMILGTWGLRLLAWCSQHSFLINGIVVAYGVFLALAHINCQRLKHASIERLVAALKDEGATKEALDNVRISWDEIIKERSFFPFITNQLSLWVWRTTPDSLQRLLNKKELIDKALTLVPSLEAGTPKD